MRVNKKEYDAVFAAIDFIASNADGADEDNYPHDILDGLRSIADKAKKENFNRKVKSQVKRKIKEFKPKK